MITLVTELVLTKQPEPRQDEAPDDEAPLRITDRERSALSWSGLAPLLALAALLLPTLPAGAPLRGESGDLSESPFLNGIAFIIALIFGFVGTACGVRVGIITSGSAMWAIMAPVIVPMLMLLDVPAETSQALFRIAHSGSTAITPMSPYFIMALGFMQRYQKNAGIGTLASHTLPLAICMTLSWTVLFFLWWGFGIPLGPGAPVR